MVILITEKAKSEMNHKSVKTDPSRIRTKVVLKAASDLFLAKGYEGVSLEMIVAKAGGSFRDVYREFGSKEKLFLRVLQSLCDDVLAPLERIGADSAQAHRRSLEQALSEVGREVLAVLLSPRLLALHRLVVSESKRFPAIGRRWYESGPNGANRAVAEVIARYSERGQLSNEDPCLLAAVFLDSLVNSLQLRRLTGIVVSEADIEDRVRVCVRVFLKGIHPF